jgi:ABC-2 type transport system permease protein
MTLTAADLAPAGEPAPPATRIRSQALFDARVLLRNGEQLLLTIVLPALLLVGLTLAAIPDLGDPRRIDVVAPGVLALAVLSTAFTGQAISTAFDRRYGVLRLLGTTPLGRSGLLAGRVLAVLVVELVQVVVLGTVALGLAWRPDPVGLLLWPVVGLAGTAAFVSLGLLLAGTLRSEAVLAAANLLWVLLVALGGVVVPVSGSLGRVAAVLPSGALGNASRAALQGGRLDGVAIVVLLLWAVAGSLLAVRFFRWE